MVYKKLFEYKTNYDLYDKLVRVHLLMKHIELQEQMIRILIYFVVYGINKNVENKLIEAGVIKHKQQMANSKTFLKENGLIYKKRNKQWFVVDDLRHIINSEITFSIKCIKN